MSKCIDCGKKLSNYRAKRCKPCAGKYYIKMHPELKKKIKYCSECKKELKGHGNPKLCHSCNSKITSKKDGFFIQKHYCECGDEITGHSRNSKYCQKCKGKVSGEKIKTTLCKHHIDTHHYNEQEDNIIYLSRGAHSKAHGSLNKLIAELLERRIIRFDRNECIYKMRRIDDR